MTTYSMTFSNTMGVYGGSPPYKFDVATDVFDSALFSAETGRVISLITKVITELVSMVDTTIYYPIPPQIISNTVNLAESVLKIAEKSLFETVHLNVPGQLWGTNDVKDMIWGVSEWGPNSNLFYKIVQKGINEIITLLETLERTVKYQRTHVNTATIDGGPETINHQRDPWNFVYGNTDNVTSFSSATWEKIT